MAAKRKTKPAARRRRSSAGWRPPKLEQHHLDLIGLALVAFAAFLAFVLYMGAAGGRVGDATEEGLRFLLGGAAYLGPPAVCGAGVLIVLRQLVPAIAPFRAGAICVFLGITLGLAAGSLGLGPGASAHEPLLDQTYVSARGGVVGELLFEGARNLFSDFGAHILFLFLMTGGTLLLTGASIAGLVSAMSRQVATTTQRVRRQAERTVVLARDVAPPEPPGVEPVVHATHVEAPALDAESRFPDLFGGDEEGRGQRAEAELVDETAREHSEDPSVVEAPMPDPDAPPPVQQPLTPMGNARTGVTEADDVDYTLPKPQFLKHSNGKPKVKSGADERVGAQLVEALGHFGVEAQVVGSVSGPHVTRYELRLAPGIKMSKVSNMRDDLAYALAADDVRILAPIPG